ncbi:14218_t:CDS:2, partial [Racocetra fulgida]
MSKVNPSPNPLISMWVLLEGTPSSVEIHVKPSDFKQILKQEFEALKDVRPEKIEFFSDKDRTQALFGNSKVKYQLPHSSGSWDLLRKDVIINFSKLSKFENAKVGDLYFEISEGNHEENLDIKNEFQFNELNGVNILIQTQLIDKKPYNKWDIRDVFTNVLHRDYNGSLGQAFNLDELPNYNSVTVEEMKFFVEEIKKMMKVFKNNINVNDATVREYISVFMKTAVDHIQAYTNNSAQLYVEANLYGFKGYGPVDYLVKLDDFAVLVNEAKLEDLTKGIAQNIMQLHSASEVIPPFLYSFVVLRVGLTIDAYFQSLLGKRKLEQTEFESSQQQLFGIVTTGVSWYFICWTGSPEKPKVEISCQYNCDFEGEMQSEKNVVSYIVHILENQDD